MESLIGIVAGATLSLSLFAILTMVARSLLVICRPNEAVILSGRKKQLADGSSVGYRVVLGGRIFRVPLLEQVSSMNLRSIPIDLKVANAYSKGGIPLKVHAIANVKVSSDRKIIGNAIERFLGRDPAEIARVAKESLEGHLRGVLANLTPEEVNEDRLKFATALVDEAESDFSKMGLQLDTLKIQNVSDDANYLASIGRARIAVVLRDAEMAESFSKSEAQQREAEAKRAGEVAIQQAGTTTAQKENELRRLRAELEATARVAEETAVQAAQQARMEAEKKLQIVRTKLEETRLLADKVLPAQAEQQASAFRARGEAATIEENGKALAEVLRLLAQVWAEAGPNAREIFLLQNIDVILETIAARVREVSVANINVLDGGDGTALARYAASYPAAVRQILDEISLTTGVPIRSLLGTEGARS
ncbi:MAG: flotillin family protein [Thermoanaerobaculia bacterium]|nr:flotillin family protein [Thermoanaerobaculia bacterium]